MKIVDLLGIEHPSRGDPPPFWRKRSPFLAAQSGNPLSTAYGRTTASLDSRKTGSFALRESFPLLEIPLSVSHAMDEILRLADTMVVVSEDESQRPARSNITSWLDLRPMTVWYG